MATSPLLHSTATNTQPNPQQPLPSHCTALLKFTTAAIALLFKEILVFFFNCNKCLYQSTQSHSGIGLPGPSDSKDLCVHTYSVDDFDRLEPARVQAGSYTEGRIDGFNLPRRFKVRYLGGKKLCSKVKSACNLQC